MGPILVLILQLILLIFVVRAVLSWVRPKPDSKLSQLDRMVRAVTEPIVAPVRRLIPPTGAIDLSVTAIVLVIVFVLMPVAARL